MGLNFDLIVILYLFLFYPNPFKWFKQFLPTLINMRNTFLITSVPCIIKLIWSWSPRSLFIYNGCNQKFFLTLIYFLVKYSSKIWVKQSSLSMTVVWLYVTGMVYLFYMITIIIRLLYDWNLDKKCMFYWKITTADCQLP